LFSKAWLLLFCCLGSPVLAAPAKTEECQPIAVEFSREQLFDETEQPFYFFHRWANSLHIYTQQQTLINESNWYLSQCNLTDPQLAEWERKLRKLRYIEHARIEQDKKNRKILITTTDNWSLLPTLDFSRKGGQNRYAIGLKERNFIGRGIELELKFFEDARRSGFIVDTAIPHLLHNNSKLGMRFADNDDGQQTALLLHKTFASNADTYAYQLAYHKNERIDTLFHNDDDEYEYGHDIRSYLLRYDWLAEHQDEKLFRLGLGYQFDRHQFFVVEQNTPPFLPTDRQLAYPFISFEYERQNYQEMSDIYNINAIEDINMGWRLNGRIGLSDGQDENSTESVWQLTSNTFLPIGEYSYLALSAAVDFHQNQRQDRFRGHFNIELFLPISAQWKLYFKNQSDFSDNEYLDQIVTLGGNNGLRGYPIQYQHGQESYLFSVEGRYYPNINIWRLFDVAGVIFYDRGKASGSTDLDNIETGWLDSLGFGVRLYSPHFAGDARVIHLDLAYALSANDEVKGLEFRLLTRTHF